MKRSDTRPIHVNDHNWQWKMIDGGTSIRIYHYQWNREENKGMYYDIRTGYIIGCDASTLDRMLENNTLQIHPQHVKDWIMKNAYGIHSE